MVLKSEARGHSRSICSSDHPKLSRDLFPSWDAATPLLHLLLHDNYPSNYSPFHTHDPSRYPSGRFHQYHPPLISVSPAFYYAA